MAKRRHSKRRRRGGFFYKLLSVLVICGAILLAVTLFFRVNTIEVSGQQRYSAEEIREASGVAAGDNLYLLNKYDVANRIVQALPYIESIHPYRKLPDTLVIEVKECGKPMAVIQDEGAWLVSAQGKIVARITEAEAAEYGVISGCELLAPSVGTPIALATEYVSQQTSLIQLLTAWEDAGLTEEVRGVRLDDLSYLQMDYTDRFTVRIAYGADYAWELQRLIKSLEKDVIQSNMTGVFDLQLDTERVYFIPDLR